MAVSNGVKKTLIVIIILVVLGAVFYVYSKKEVKAPTVENYQPAPAQNQPAAQTTTPATQTNLQDNLGANYTSPQAPSGGENLGSNIQVYEVDFDGTAYSPEVSNLKAGDYIFFKNKSGAAFWPVSVSAPVQSGSADYADFDAKQNILPGKEFKFQFTLAGQWKFIDKLNPAATGTVNVIK